MVSVVALNATEMIAKEEWWSSDEDDSGKCENSEDTVPYRTSLLQEDPSQKRSEDGITEESTDNELKTKESE